MRPEGRRIAPTKFNLIEQHSGQFAMVVAEAAVEQLDQRRSLGLHPAPGQVGEAVGVTLAGSQHFDDVPLRQRVQRGRRRGPGGLGAACLDHIAQKWRTLGRNLCATG